MRVLHAPTNIGNQPWTLSRYERRLGVDSELVVNYGTSLGFKADKVLSPIGSLDHLRDRLMFGLRAPFQYDVFHYYFGRSLLFWDDYATMNLFPFLDFDVAHKLGKRLFFTLQGCDARIAGLSTIRNRFTPCRKDACTSFGLCISNVDNARKHFIREILPKVNRVFFLNPELGYYVGRGEFLPYSSVDIAALKFIPPAANRRPRIMHAPTNGQIKGTPRILEAMEALKKSYDFEFVLVRDMAHEQALQLYQSADIVIDQVLAGWYGGFAVEAMAMGKPVLCYLREQDMHFVPREMIVDSPVVNIRPDCLADDIASVLDRRNEWRDWSARSRSYVEQWHDPGKIAAAMVELYRDPAMPCTAVDLIRGATNAHGGIG